MGEWKTGRPEKTGYYFITYRHAMMCSSAGGSSYARDVDLDFYDAEMDDWYKYEPIAWMEVPFEIPDPYGE